jgi:hypothetical protein
MNFSPISVLIDGRLSSVEVWFYVLLTAGLLTMAGMAALWLVRRRFGASGNPYLALASLIALCGIGASERAFTIASNGFANLLSREPIVLCFMPTRHAVRDTLPGALSAVAVITYAIASRSKRAAA